LIDHLKINSLDNLP